MAEVDQNARHLKSRIAHLELMWDRERKRCNELEANLRVAQQQAQSGQTQPQPSLQRRFSRTSSSSPGNAATSHDHPLVSPANSPILTDPSRLERLRRMSGELDHERKLKVDLMANLKQTTDAKHEVERELAEMRKSRVTLQAKLDEVQDEFEELWLTMRSQLAELPVEEAPADPTQRQASLSAMSLRHFVQSLEAGYEQRHRRLLRELLGDAQAEIDDTVPMAAIEKRVTSKIEDLQSRSIDAAGIVKLCQLLEHLGPLEVTRPVSERFQEACDKSLRRILALEADSNTYRQFLAKVVPTYVESIFNTLSRSSSFSAPLALTSDAFDSPQQEAYRSFLQTNTDSLSHTIKKYMSSHTKSRQKISYRGFSVGDLALFLPTRNAGSHSWAAFNVNAPHYFLDMRGVKVEGKDFLIGRIERIQDYLGEPGALDKSHPAPAASPVSEMPPTIAATELGAEAGQLDAVDETDVKSPDAGKRWWLVQIAQKSRPSPAPTPAA